MISCKTCFHYFNTKQLFETEYDWKTQLQEPALPALPALPACMAKFEYGMYNLFTLLIN